MGDRGPAPAREEERRRTNEPAHPIWKLGPAELAELPFAIELSPEPPPVPTKSGRQEWRQEHGDRVWGELVTNLYEAIKTDPMVAWMTTADWATLMVFLEDLDRELKPQVVGISEVKIDRDGDVVGGDPVLATVPMKGAKMAAINNLLKTFGIGEANRLRMQKEVTLFPQFTTGGMTGETDEDIARNRLELLQGGQA